MNMRFERFGAAAALLIYSILATACVHSVAGKVGPGVVQKTQHESDPIKDNPRIQKLEAELRDNPKNFAVRQELASLYEGYTAYDQALAQYTEMLMTAGTEVSEEATAGLRRAAAGAGRISEAIPFL